MTEIHKAVRQPPLLHPPEALQKSPWVEISKEHIRLLRGELERTEHTDIWDFANLAANMRSLGVDASAEVGRNPGAISSILHDISLFPLQHYLRYAVTMDIMGCDVRKAFTDRAKEFKKNIKIYVDDIGFSDAVSCAANLMRLGFDVSDAVREHEPELRRRLRLKQPYFEFIELLAETKILGFDASQEIKEEKPTALNYLSELSKGDMKTFASYAKKLMELGLLTPNRHGGSQPGMPPLKRYGGEQ